MDPRSDAALAADLAQAAGRALLELRAGFGPVDAPGRRRALMDAGDQRAQQLLADALAVARPDDAILSEEAPDSDARLAAGRVWILDPLDGTDEFGEGRGDFAVHVALWQRAAGPDGTGALTDAAVDVPVLGETWRTDQPGAGPAPLPTSRPLRIAISRSRPPVGMDELLRAASAELVAGGLHPHGIDRAHVGSVGAKLGEVMAGRAEAYLHSGGLNEWDLAAPYACALARGYVAVGPTQRFNQMPPTAGGVLIAHPAIADVLARHWVD
jgi:3'(2'), 5'-bisphosphate nucleotidase